MKKTKILGFALAVLASSVATSRADITFSFESVGQGLTFNGDSTFDFTSGFNVTSSNPTGATVDTGSISGTFTIGSVTSPFPGLETAPVTSSSGAQITISDGAGHNLTGNIDWESITSIGTSGTLNLSGLLNFTSISYGGSQLPLADLAGIGSGSASISFNFVPGMDVDELKMGGSTGTLTDNYTGNIDAVPEPTTMIAGAFLLLPMGASTLRALRKNRAS